ncbi:MAG: hypothetical protein HYU51_05835 [Candidatus Rokubacteria bacterium]|nr:hypothetical protein [Candidatus Rokubacteria bacterium]
MSTDPPVVAVISLDPRTSHRANEAMRIGLGVVAGENEVVFLLRGPAVHLLDEDTDDLVDGDDIAKFRANLRSLGVPFHVEADAVPDRPDWNVEQHPIVRVTTDDAAGIIRQARRVMVF